MRTSIVFSASKFLSLSFAVTLALGLLPMQALAAPSSLTLIPTGWR